MQREMQQPKIRKKIRNRMQIKRGRKQKKRTTRSPWPKKMPRMPLKQKRAMRKKTRMPRRRKVKRKARRVMDHCLPMMWLR